MRAIVSGWLLLAALLLSSCGYRVDSFRYRMTVEVETPEGLRTGSAVREVTYTVPPNIPMLGEDRPSWGIKGEAVAVDLPDGKVLFALLVGDGHNNLQPHLGISTLMREKGSRMARPIEIWPAMPTTRTPKFETLMPMLVTFGDINDPTSVEDMGPNDLPAIFGSGITLKRIYVEKTDEPIDREIGRRLEWLGDYPEPSLDPGHGLKDFSLPALLKQGAFRMGTE